MIVKIYSDEMYPVHNPVDVMGYGHYTEIEMTETEWKDFCEAMNNFYRVQQIVGSKAMRAMVLGVGND